MVVFNFIVVGLLLAILQTTICMPTPLWLPAPDFYYILVAYLAFRLDLMRSLIILFPLVCILDVLSGTILGMYALLCFSSYFLLRLLSAKLPVNQFLYQIPLVGLSYLAVSWVVYLLSGIPRTRAAGFLVLVEDDRADDAGRWFILSPVFSFRLAPETFPSQFPALEQIAAAHRQPAQATGLSSLFLGCEMV